MKLRLYYDGFERSTKVELLEEIFVGKMYVPKGFVSDGGSIPRFFWRLFNPLDARYLKAYIQHDFIYATGMRERKDADILLRKGLETAQMNFLGRWAVYFSVRLFGSKHYHKFEKI